MKKEKPIVVRVFPVEKVITEKGTHIITRVVGETKKDIDTAVEKFNSVGTFGQLVENKEANSQKQGASFGISDWSNCGWNPKGPKPNWVSPKDPSKN